MVASVLTTAYLTNADTVWLARDLLGKYLVRRLNSGLLIHSMITETEAYHGAGDQACHGRFGKTQRSEVMFRQGGVWYVYLCYGVHWLLNIITGPVDFPAAVLIRSIDIAKGPGRLTKALHIDKSFNGQPAHPLFNLWLEDHEYIPPAIEITPRIGIAYAGEDAYKPWRFVVKDK